MPNKRYSSIEECFWSQVDPKGDDDCWPWLGFVDKTTGYARYSHGVHAQGKCSHLSLTISGRPRPGNLQALHSCDNRACVNPKHLRWGTHRDNMDDVIARRRANNARKTHCKYGHEYTVENTRYAKMPGKERERTCWQCIRNLSRDRREQRAAARVIRLGQDQPR